MNALQQTQKKKTENCNYKYDFHDAKNADRIT